VYFRRLASMIEERREGKEGEADEAWRRRRRSTRVDDVRKGL